MIIPVLSAGPVTLRPPRVREWRQLNDLLQRNRSWLRNWEATNPEPGVYPIGLKAGIRVLLSNARQGLGLPFIVEYDAEMVGQVNISGITRGALSIGTCGYWISESHAGKGIIPTAVALATDYCLLGEGIHRMEICIRPENDASLRVVQKLGFEFEGIRRKYIHIAGDWRDHRAFSVIKDEIGDGLVARLMATNSLAR